jgi:tRNA threonylcarbamoyladenosine biosynthesis protein TsaE
MNTEENEIISRRPAQTREFAAGLARTLEPGSVLALYGNLGAGKTCFVQGLAEGLEVVDAVSSPTFTLINEYRGRLPLYHIDLYRISDPDEAFDFGLDEYLFGDGITAIEWAEHVESLLPDCTIRIRLQPGRTPDQRVITVDAQKVHGDTS